MMYPEPTNIWESIEYSSLGIGIAESLWAFPMIESLHVMALVTVFGTVLIMDLRLIGLASTNVPVSTMSSDTLKWTWIGFVIAAITGTLLFISKASTYMVNPYFLTKMGLMAAAGLNMLIFHFLTYKSVADWDSSAALPKGAKMAGILSIVFWLIIVFCGRAIGFTLGIYY
ncbi:DUF6644 family protein [Alteraurantiacibacter aquimixticola]|uniref:DUF6644 domain-containing protein n=1 Tax=Alteraurantiacibacter aquimixticola TaxID=2489173 RepID=A0A4T3F457_9SPHN|nr:DUF6644 family protein [Alteraurantiacibacter aquimixticola]TIX51561.1 hypothetical protein E5222_03660 [Alteraurantiacibacter aquimixticola]